MLTSQTAGDCQEVQCDGSGGTRISSAYDLAATLAERDFPSDSWNVYFFHFSDGDNLGNGDNERCFHLLRERLLPMANLFGYGQVESRAGSGAFLGVLFLVTADGGPGTGKTTLLNAVAACISDRERIADLGLDHLFVIHPGTRSYALRDRISAKRRM